jgi:hypothetical protein
MGGLPSEVASILEAGTPQTAFSPAAHRFGRSAEKRRQPPDSTPCKRGIACYLVGPSPSA